MTHSRKVKRYIVSDVFAAIVTWIVFFIFRKLVFEKLPIGIVVHQIFSSDKLFVGIVTVSVFWIFVNFLSGYYSYVLRKNIFQDILNTFKTAFVGVIILFFLLLLDDKVLTYKNYYVAGAVLFSLQFVFTLIPRIYITKKTLLNIKNGNIQFNTIIIGSGERAKDIYNELHSRKVNEGNNFIGYVTTPSGDNGALLNELPLLGNISDLPDIISRNKVEELIIAIEPGEKDDLNEVQSWLGFSEITVKALAELNQFFRGKKKITNILGTPLLEIEHELMPLWQQALKKIIDILFSLLAIVLLSPFYIFCAFGIKISSKGPILFTQQRVGKNGKEFKLFKFRSMYTDAEKHGPNLARENDNRCTPFGKFLRKTKLDEIPNFFNVLKGDMSLVGPRPERQFYIDQIVKIAPKYKQLQKIRPGITSLGQVRFGYASDVEQMTKRLRYDILYMENMTLYTDFLIIYYTFVLLFKGRHV